MIREAKRDVQCDLETTKEESGRVGVEGAEPPIDAPIRGRNDAAPPLHHFISEVKRIITVLVFHFPTPFEQQNKSDLLVDYEHWGASLGKETEFCVCENGIVAKSYLLKLNPRKKCFFILPFRQHRGCPLCGINKTVI